MNITPKFNCCQNNTILNNIPKFTGRKEDIEQIHEYNDRIAERQLWERKVTAGELTGGLAGAALASTFVALPMWTMWSDSENAHEEFANKVQEICTSEDIKKDTFKVEDMTGDKKVDIILYKKDGSKVVLDMENQQILQETKKLDVIQ